MATVGRKLLSAIIKSGSIQDYLKLNLGGYLFRESEVELFDSINEHVLKFGKIPAHSTLVDKGHHELLVDTEEPPLFYMEGVETRYLRSSLKTMITEANQKLIDENDNEAYQGVLDSINLVHSRKNRNVLHDFRDSYKLVFAEYVKQNVMGDEYALKFGWDGIDDLTGGMKGGDLISFVGRPAAGKTFKLLYIAYNSWRKKRRPLFVSMEMNALIINQRLSAMHAQVPLTHLLKGQLSTSKLLPFKNSLKKLGTAETPFYVVDGNLTATVDDILMLCRQLSITDVYVDGAYLLRHGNAKLSKWDRMSENAEMLKQRVAQDLNIPCICSYQFSKAPKKNASEKVKAKAGLDDIYGSDTIAQLSTIVMGLLQEESIETQHSRKVSILKGRNGETGEFFINWDFMNMDFSQLVTKKDKITKDSSDSYEPASNQELIYL